MQYVIITKKIFQNLKNGKVIRLYVNMLFFKCFMTNKAPSGVKRHHEDIEPERCQMAKMFFFLFQASSKLCESILTVFTQNSSILL